MKAVLISRNIKTILYAIYSYLLFGSFRKHLYFSFLCMTVIKLLKNRPIINVIPVTLNNLHKFSGEESLSKLSFIGL